MSRPSLLHLPGERHSHRRRRAHTTSVSVAEPVAQVHDPDVQRVREAGGPLDHASYACACGYVFDAAVSTSVGCPHCGCSQAW
ncbi:MAG TPA: hypothetical protein VK765_00530 [Solirubrobacteraceae bacterium]|jgi:hypothetical protein|nr:hypothetical protein [Solirubrobacteraceae bacterium]